MLRKKRKKEKVIRQKDFSACFCSPLDLQVYLLCFIGGEKGLPKFTFNFPKNLFLVWNLLFFLCEIEH